MSLKNLMISVSGVRGIVGDGLTPEVAMRFALAYGSAMGPGRVVVGRDSRATGEMIQYAVWAGLMASGCDVVDLGIAPTPTVELATEAAEHIGGIIITASHNPREWNALKLLAADGLFLGPAEGARIVDRVQREEFRYAAWDRMGRVTHERGAIDEHLRRVAALPLVEVERIRKRRFRVVADPCNGAGGTILPPLLEMLGCEAVFINEEPHGRFPRSPEPLPAHLGELGEAVRQHRADFGVAVDPDVDRLALVDERGAPLGEEYTLALATDFVLSHTPGDVVVNASTSMVIDDLAARYRVGCHRTRVGEIHVALRARELGAAMAGEGNGGVIYPRLHYGRDAIVGIALILQHLAEQGGSLSQLNGRLPFYAMVKDKITLPFGVDAGAIVERCSDPAGNGRIDRIDGVKFVYDRAWLQIRASNTEPIIRIMAEAPTATGAQALVDRLKQQVAGLL